MKNNFFPVIHIKSVEHALQNAILAQECGADGVFLINMGDVEQRVLFEALDEVLKAPLNIRIGVNFLCDLNHISLDFPETMMLWSDHLRGYRPAVRRYQFYGPYAFKYQKQPRDLAGDLAEFENMMDVITTSGVGTGRVPNLEKIKTIVGAASKPIAIASGINAENVTQFKPLVRDFLVGSSIGFDSLIREKVIELAETIHS